MKYGKYGVPAFALILLIIGGMTIACNSKIKEPASDNLAVHSQKTDINNEQSNEEESIYNSDKNHSNITFSSHSAPTVNYTLVKLNQSAIFDILKIKSSDLKKDRDILKSPDTASYYLEISPHILLYLSDFDHSLDNFCPSVTGTRPLYDVSQFPKKDLTFKSRQEAIEECMNILRKTGAVNYQVSDTLSLDKSAAEQISLLLQHEDSISEVFTQDDECYTVLLEQVVPELDITIYQGNRFSDRQMIEDPRSRASLAIRNYGIYSIELFNPLNFTVDTANTKKLLSEEEVRNIISEYGNTLLDSPKIEIKSLKLCLQLPLQQLGKNVSENGTMQYIWVIETLQSSDDDEKGITEIDVDIVIDAETGEILYGL